MIDPNYVVSPEGAEKAKQVYACYQEKSFNYAFWSLFAVIALGLWALAFYSISSSGIAGNEGIVAFFALLLAAILSPAVFINVYKVVKNARLYKKCIGNKKIILVTDDDTRNTFRLFGCHQQALLSLFDNVTYKHILATQNLPSVERERANQEFVALVADFVTKAHSTFHSSSE